MKRCDLHSHSHFSDGTLPPAELVKLAEKAGVCALALTDHNTTKGLSEFMKAGESSEVITVPGCEFSTGYEGTELHIVGLFLAENSWSEVEDYVELMHIAKRHSNYSLIKALRENGYVITYEEVAASTDAEEFNRAHVAKLLFEKGMVKDINHAFKTILSEKNGLYKPPKRLGSIATVRFIKDCGGVAILAHPFLNLDEAGLRKFLPEAKKAGLDAIETRYSKFDEETTRLAEHIAEEYGVKQSGGSDFHGSVKPDISIGTGTGNLFVPFEFYENLKAGI